MDHIRARTAVGPNRFAHLRSPEVRHAQGMTDDHHTPPVSHPTQRGYPYQHPNVHPQYIATMQPRHMPPVPSTEVFHNANQKYDAEREREKRAKAWQADVAMHVPGQSRSQQHMDLTNHVSQQGGKLDASYL